MGKYDNVNPDGPPPFEYHARKRWEALRKERQRPEHRRGSGLFGSYRRSDKEVTEAARQKLNDQER